MKEKNYSEQIIEVLTQPYALGGLTSKIIASYINKPEDFTRVYLNRLSKKRPGKTSRIEVMNEKRGKFNIYHISARTLYEFRSEILNRKLAEKTKEVEILEEALRHFTEKNKVLKDKIKELKN